MASSGIKVSEDVLKTFDTLKFSSTKGAKKGDEPRKSGILYSVFSEDLKVIEVHALRPRSEEGTLKERFDGFLDNLVAEFDKKPVYVVYDFEYETKQGGTNEKLLFVSWCPDDSKARLRMCHSATKDAFKKALTGLEKEIHITERSDFDYEAVRQLMLK